MNRHRKRGLSRVPTVQENQRLHFSLRSLLGNPESSTTQAAWTLLKHADEPLWHQFIGLDLHKVRGFCPVLISGERAPITLALLRGLERGLTAFSDFAGSLQWRDSSRIFPYNSPQTSKNGWRQRQMEYLPHASEITDLFESATRQIGVGRWNRTVTRSLMSSASFSNLPRKIQNTAICLCYRVSPNLPQEVIKRRC